MRQEYHTMAKKGTVTRSPDAGNEDKIRWEDNDKVSNYIHM